VPPATRSSSGRPLALVLLLLVLLYGGMVLGGRYSPALGLDLRGGTTVTLTPKASGGAKVTKSELNTAVDIMRQRVNNLGVGNAEVATEGSNIVVSVPGKNKQDALAQIGETALLSIRQVYESNDPNMTGSTVQDTSATTPTASPSAATNPSGSPSATTTSPAAGSATTTPSVSPSVTVSPSAAGSSSPKALGAPGAQQAHAEPAGFVRAAASSAAPTASATPAVAPAASAPAGAASASSPAPASSPSPTIGPQSTSGVNPAKAETTPSAAELAAYNSLNCDDPANQKGGQPDLTNAFMVACGDPGGAWFRYMLYPTLIQGKEISSADAELIGTTGTVWGVNLNFKSGASSRWASFTTKGAAANPQWDTAIVLDGQVESAEYIAEAITGGQTQISGNFTHKTASQLANVLKYGALPLAFEVPTAQTVSATLGNTELQAGLLAGAIGLVLVLLYSFFYYRGLSVVTVSSLALSAAIQYPTIVLLGKAINYTLSLAGIAGLIVAIGVTADSFVVFFERLRDEVRDGNSLRTSVERGWVRARRTIVSADLVSLIASVILYLLAIGDVRGFAFTLGLSTIVDLVVVFLFTKPLITLLAKTKFFGDGHPLSGLSAARLGVDRLKTAAPVVRRVAPPRKGLT
jgi:preprotein translocase subunit SecD